MAVKTPKPEDFDVAPSTDISIRQQVSRSNLPLETKSAILAVLDKPPKREKENTPLYRAVEARVSDATKLTNTSLSDLEKVIRDALRATLTRVFYRKVYRENGKLWKVFPKALREPDHAMRLKVVELFMKPTAVRPKTKKPSRVTDDTDTASRLRDREEALEVDGNGNGERE